MAGVGHHLTQGARAPAHSGGDIPGSGLQSQQQADEKQSHEDHDGADPADGLAQHVIQQGADHAAAHAFRRGPDILLEGGQLRRQVTQAEQGQDQQDQADEPGRAVAVFIRHGGDAVDQQGEGQGHRHAAADQAQHPHDEQADQSQGAHVGLIGPGGHDEADQHDDGYGADDDARDILGAGQLLFAAHPAGWLGCGLFGAGSGRAPGAGSAFAAARGGFGGSFLSHKKRYLICLLKNDTI